MRSLFISFASEDKSAADALCQALETHDCVCWIAPRNIPPGSQFGRAIVDAIDSAKALVLVLSRSSANSDHVIQEVNRAFERRIPIVPVRLEDFLPTGAMGYYVSSRQWLDAFPPPFEARLEEIARTIKASTAQRRSGSRRVRAAPSAIQETSALEISTSPKPHLATTPNSEDPSRLLSAAAAASSARTDASTDPLGPAASGRPSRLVWLLALVLLAGLALWVTFGRPPAGAPSRTATGVPKQSDPVTEIVSRAFANVAARAAPGARTVLARGRVEYPGQRAIEQPLRELEEGTLVLFQEQTRARIGPLQALSGTPAVTLDPNDNYRFLIVSSRSCFVYVYQQDARPSIERLFPNPRFGPAENPLQGTRVYWVPQDAASAEPLWFHLDGHRGRERIFFVALRSPLPDPDGFAQWLLHRTGDPRDGIEAYLARVVQRTVPGPIGCFADGSVQVLDIQHE